MATSTFTPFVIGTKEVPTLPKKGCLGYVDSIGEAKISQSGVYVVQKIVLGGSQGAPAKTYINLLYRPEWLREGFTTDGLDKSANFVYMNNIGGARDPGNPKKAFGQLSVLAGLAGSWDNFIQLSGLIITGVVDVADENVPETVQQILSNFVSENNPEIGYILKQKTEETGEVVDGKKERVKADGYEIDRFFFPETETQSVMKQAAAGRLVQTFEG